ncbi:hypothetical protein BJ138DRAFT_1162611, partial [Hygrophoropsis aurantiaca]
MVQSGEWDRIQHTLSARLAEAGWADDVRGRVQDRARALLSGTGAGAGCTFHALLADVGGRGGGDGGIGADSGGRVPIPRDIEKEVLAEISVYVR